MFDLRVGALYCDQPAILRSDGEGKNQDESVGFIEWPISIEIIVYISQSFSVFMQKVHRMIFFY